MPAQRPGGRGRPRPRTRVGEADDVVAAPGLGLVEGAVGEARSSEAEVTPSSGAEATPTLTVTYRLGPRSRTMGEAASRRGSGRPSSRPRRARSRGRRTTNSSPP